ncbi:Gfo/Idh/MocA family protein [Devosia riboflavina]|uniref:Gfo/Idh/MocA family protein n=1 Tax=Devosia riboflavina TaxID=46914 RepID=UPI0006921EF5|nr:Gfo/Idh/MocA family oxidoreductase [Devosia riboflavina]
MTTQKIYRAGAIGHTGRGDYGHEMHLAYQHLPMTEMIAIADPDEAGRNKAVVDSGAQRGYSDYREMLAVEKLDIVSVSPREAAQHAEMCIAAAQAGSNIYCDKPLATDLEEADAIIEACDNAGVKIAVAHQSRYIEPFLTAKRMLDNGDIGTLLSMHARGKEDHRGGGEDAVVLGVHMTDLMRWFAGEPQWVVGRVTQDGREITKADAWQPKELNGLVAGDSVLGLYGFDNGVVGHFVSVRNQHVRGDRWGFVLVGTKGTIAMRFFMDFESASRISVTYSNVVPEEGGEWKLLDVPPEPIVPGSPALPTGHPPTRGNRLAIADLVKSIEENREPLCNGRDARKALEMILAIYTSQFSGQRVGFPLTDRRHPLKA